MAAGKPGAYDCLPAHSHFNGLSGHVLLRIASLTFLILNLVLFALSGHSIARGHADQTDSYRALVLDSVADTVIGARNTGLDVIDVATGKAIAIILPNERIDALGVDDSRKLLVATGPDKHLYLIALDTNQIVATLSLPSIVTSLSVDELSGILFMTYQSGDVATFSLETFSFINQTGLARRAMSSAIDPITRRVIVGNRISGNPDQDRTQNIAVVDMDSLAVLARLQAGREPVDAAVNPRTREAAVVNEMSDDVTTIAMDAMTIKKTIPVGERPVALAYHDCLNTLVVAGGTNNGWLKLVHPDAGEVETIATFPDKVRDVKVHGPTNTAIIAGKDGIIFTALPNPIPSIVALSTERLIREAGEVTVTMTGASFIDATAIYLNGASIPAAYAECGVVEVTIPEQYTQSTGDLALTAVNPAPGGGVSAPFVLTVENPLPVITSLEPAQIEAGTLVVTVTIRGSGFFPDTVLVVNGEPRALTVASQVEAHFDLTTTEFAHAGTVSVMLSNALPGGGASQSVSLLVVNPAPTLASLNPSSVNAGSPDLTILVQGTGFVASSQALLGARAIATTVASATQLQMTIPADALRTAGTYPVKIVNQGPGGGESASLPFAAQPGSNAQPLPDGSFGKQYEDLVPPDATIESYDPKRFAIVTGLVRDRAGNALPGVAVSIHSRPQYGTAQTDAHGRFSIPLDGGGTVTIAFHKAGYLESHRQVDAPWNNLVNVETLSMIQEDTAATAIAFNGNSSTILSHKSTPYTDDRGTRSLSIVFTGDNRAFVKNEDVTETQVAQITVRATEYATPQSMPASLPPNVAYTYCSELAADGTKNVRFEKPVTVYIENFLGFSVGEVVPVGYYDRDRAVWVPSNNGVVVRLLDTNGDGIVDAYTNGQSQYPAPGLTDPAAYPPNATFWRFQVSHFTPWDANWMGGFPSGAIQPNPQGEPVVDAQCEHDDCQNIGSYVESKGRIFHEDIPIPGTDMILHYASNRTRGYKSVVTIPASGTTVPANLKHIIVKMEVAGRTFETTLPAQPNQEIEFVWDGTDHLGRRFPGSVHAVVRIGFAYQAVYYAASKAFAQSFGQVGTNVTGVRARQEAISWKDYTLTLRRGLTQFDAIAEGWTVSLNHHFNPADPKVLYKGDGTTIDHSIARIITTYAGGGPLPPAQADGGSALRASLGPQDIAIDGAGNLYIAEPAANRVRRVDANGIITTVAGNGQQGYGGDGGPATQAMLNYPYGLAVDNGGNLYIAEWWNHRVRKVDTNGIITTVAGSGTGGYSGDGGPATQANLYAPSDVAVDSSGNIYIASWQDYLHIRKVGPNGIITTLTSPDGLVWGQCVAVDAHGNLYLGNDDHIIKLNSSGRLTAVNIGGIARADNLTVDKSGNVYVSEFYWTNPVVRKIYPSGIVETFAGNGYFDPLNDGVPPLKTGIGYAEGLAIDNTGNLLVADGGHGRIRKISLLPGASQSVLAPGDSIFNDENGQGYVIGYTGLHKSTIDLATGKTLLTFNYSQANKLISITDRFGNVTAIERDNAGIPLSITSPDGIITSLTVDGSNHLTGVAFPDDTSYAFTYTPDGLMTGKRDPRGNRYAYHYSPAGTVSMVSDPEGGTWNYSRALSTDGTALTTLTTAQGNTTTYQHRTDSTGAYTASTAQPSGAINVFSRSSDGLTETEQSSCGMRQTRNYDLDQAYKYRYLNNFTLASPAGLTLKTAETRTYQDTNTDKLYDLITRTTTLNSRSWTETQNALAGTITITSPLGRITTHTYNPASLLTRSIAVPGRLPMTYGYDPKGRLTTTTAGGRAATVAYDPQGNIGQITTPDAKVHRYAYDPMGRLTTQELPDHSLIAYSYDENGNMTVLTTPKMINFGFDYNGVNLRSAMISPISGAYQYTYDRERNLASILFPSGKAIVNTYTNGLLSAVTTPEGVISYTYSCGNAIGSITKDAESIAYVYDGTLLMGDTRSGLLKQAIAYTYNNDFSLASMTYAGAMQTFGHDNDGLLVTASPFTISRNAQNGLPVSLTGSTLATSRTFSGYGDLDTVASAIAGVERYRYTLTRNLAGRITRKAETIEGVATIFDYAYDDNGRLTDVQKNGIAVERYTYDPQGNRLTETNTLRGIQNQATSYSNEGHAITSGTNTYQFDTDGFLAGKNSGSSMTAYNYSSRGELVSATLPNGATITHDHDPFGRRIAKRVNGTIIEKYLWQSNTRLLAVYDGSDNLIMRFTYADQRTPISMFYGGTTYYLMTDQVGSVRAVVDTSGTVVKRIDYDSFGNIINDTNPSMNIPFGFAGGFHDKDVGLVRFGARDYDPSLGRWTAKDPIDFAGGDTNLYNYVGGDGVNFIDPKGIWGEDVHSGIGNSGYGTYLWATQAGLSPSDAQAIAMANVGTDGGFAGFLPTVGLQSRHFNQGRCGNDSRDGWASTELNRAVDYYKSGNKKAALGHLGKGLHSIQDKPSHRGWDTGWHGMNRHPNWYDSWADPRNATARNQTETSTKHYFELFLTLTGQR